MEIKKRHRTKFIKLANELDELLKEIREYNSEANYYVGNDELCLMKGETHDNNCSAIRENVSESKWICGLSGGDW